MTRRRGFTLIEILVVIGIIMFLAAFVIVAAVRFGNNSREQATRAMIQRLGMGINRYYGTYRIYPAEVGMSVKTAMSIYDFMVPHPDNSNSPATTSPSMMEFNGGEIRHLGDKDWVVDSWGKPILYYAIAPTSAGNIACVITPGNTCSHTECVAIRQAQVGQFTMLSKGPNGIEGDNDDITLSKVTY